MTIDDPNTAQLEQAHDLRIRVGIGGWTFPPWRNHFYPPKLVQRRELEYASRHVTAIEINGTYYNPQKPATYAKWRDETPAGFVFSVKAPRFATDRKILASAGNSIDDFVFGGLAEFGNRLGPVLWQLPAYKSFDRVDLAAFFDLLPRDLDGYALRHVLEVRHASFMCGEYVELARKYRIPTVFTDSPEFPSFADVTGDFIYARLMRSEAKIATGYAPQDLDRWAKRASTWSNGGAPADLPYVGQRAATKAKGQKPREVYLYFISGAKENNPAAATALLQRLPSSRA